MVEGRRRNTTTWGLAKILKSICLDLAERSCDAAVSKMKRVVGEVNCVASRSPIAPVRSLGQVTYALDLRSLFERLKL